MSRWSRINIIWGYSVEMIASTLLYIITRTLFGHDCITAFIHKTCDEWNDLSGILFSAALAVWLTFINIRGSLFGDFLTKHNSEAVYSRAFLTSMAAFFLTTVAMISVRGIDSFYMAHSATWLLIYSFLNLYSLIKNATDIIKLYSEFNRIVEIERRSLEPEVRAPRKPE